MSEELKPCPFCGGKKLKVESKKGEIHYSKKMECIRGIM